MQPVDTVPGAGIPSVAEYVMSPYSVTGLRPISIDSLRAVLWTLRTANAGNGGAYDRVRDILPILAVCLIWLIYTYTDLHRFAVSVALNGPKALVYITALWLLWHVVAAVASTPLPSEPSKAVQTELLALLRGATICGIFTTVVVYSYTDFMTSCIIGLALLLGLFLLSLIVLPLALLSVTVGKRLRPRRRRGLVIGSGARALRLREIAAVCEPDLEITGCLDNDYVGSSPVADKYRGDLGALWTLIRNEPFDVVLIGLPIRSHYEDIQHVINVCHSAGVECSYLGDVFLLPSEPHGRWKTELQAAVTQTRHNVLWRASKRALDLCGGIILLIILSPVMLAIAASIKLTSPGAALFVQERYGYNRRRFRMFKFRTMVKDAEQYQTHLEDANEVPGPVFKIKADPRITKVGAFLRRTSLDELPQLINVIRGDMSLVGPRPLAVRDVQRFTDPWLFRRFSVLPGITCLWQISGRSNTMFDEWIKLDLQYIDRWSFGLDLWILLRTIPAVLRCTGAM